ncbi:MAG: hypothetical protein Tsb0013_01230 [Phycisphaerales bacterium]
MTRINTNVPSLIAQRVLGANNKALNTSLERLSTGLRINRGADDPAGLIASQNLRAEKAGLATAIKNAERADQVVNIAEGGLNEISSLLTDLQSLVTASANDAGLSLEEKEANQLQIDSILQTIDRVAEATSFQGTKLLNGTFDYQASSIASTVNSFKINGAKLEFNGQREVDVITTASAQKGGFFLSTGGALNLGGAGASDGDDDQFIIEIAGSLGARQLSFASGTAVADIVSAINSFSDTTGVEATASGTGFRLDSVEYGESEFVSIKVIDDGSLNTAVAQAGIYNLSAGDTDVLNGTTAAALFSATAAENGLTDAGQDVEAFINGVKATTNGTTARINTNFLDVEIDLAYDTGNPSAAVLGKIDAFTITGGGADFQLAGDVNIAGRVSLGIANVATRELGAQTIDVRDASNPLGAKVATDFNLSDFQSGASLNAVDGNLDAGQKVIEAAIREVSSLRGRLGAFQQNTIGATIRSLGVTLENTSAAESSIRDTDFAAETASLTRSQVLAQSAQQSLLIANSNPQSALSLLG